MAQEDSETQGEKEILTTNILVPYIAGHGEGYGPSNSAEHLCSVCKGGGSSMFVMPPRQTV